ncbi:MAG: hypothetical protein ACRYGI_10660 [Janthinobacterium lividum]
MFAVEFLSEADLCRAADPILGVIGFGHELPVGLRAVGLELALPSLATDQPPRFEAWTCANPVTLYQAQGFSLATTDGLLFGAISVEAGPELEVITRDLYERLFNVIGAAGCPNLIRLYNYIPDITRLEANEERYRHFNAGRKTAFAAAGIDPHSAPAASALGTNGSELQVYFLASSTASLRIENPRQVSAYHYPERYGAAPPLFARATIVDPETDQPVLLVSGTASIVSHESLHPGDVAAQTDEVMRNLHAIFDECRTQGFEMHEVHQLKIYVRRGTDRAPVAARLETMAGPDRMVWLEADICRPELLVEVEAVCRLGRRRSAA